MPDEDRQKLFDRISPDLIRRKAWAMIGKAGLRPQDVQDLEQQLTLHLWRRLAQYDSQKGKLENFVATLLMHHAANLLRNRWAQKRDFRRGQSLNFVLTTSDPSTELGDTIDQRREARLGQRPRSEEEIAQFQVDLAALLDSLPPRERELVDHLKHHSITDAARAMGLPRTTVQSIIQRLRKRFEDAGLKIYL